MVKHCYHPLHPVQSGIYLFSMLPCTGGTTTWVDLVGWVDLFRGTNKRSPRAIHAFHRETGNKLLPTNYQGWRLDKIQDDITQNILNCGETTWKCKIELIMERERTYKDKPYALEVFNKKRRVVRSFYPTEDMAKEACEKLFANSTQKARAVVRIYHINTGAVLLWDEHTKKWY